MEYFNVCKEIWNRWVPQRGHAQVLQGELLRQIERLRYEAQHNENRNWNDDFLYYCDFLRSTLREADCLTPEEREAEQARYLALAEQARTLGAQPDCGLLVLDEVCAAVNTGLLPLEEVISCLDRAAGEVVLTGRDPDPALVGRADYITEMGKLRHPFDLGTAARPGVEY